MIHVFVGPTLAKTEPQLAVPGVRVCPPARHGDLFDGALHAGDTVVLVDGVYHQALALRHKEILAAMGRGISMIGAASIGALRAAELTPFGMLGVGTIYTSYVRGEIDGDDEVAVGQAPDGQWDALTWPVVNLRHVLHLAQAAHVLKQDRAAHLLDALRAVYYPQRTAAAVWAVCRRQGETDFAAWLAGRLDQNRHFGDLKRADALTALRTALTGWAQPAETRPAPAVWETTYFCRWSNTFARTTVDGLELATEDRLVYQQIFDPHFRERWTAYLEHRSLNPADGPVLPLDVRLAQLTGGDVPAHQVFHPPLDLRDEASVALLMEGETEQDRQAVAQYAVALARIHRSRPGFSTDAVRDDLTRQILLRVWQCTEADFDAEASARGLGCGARAVEAAKRIVPGFLDESNERAEFGHAC
ncbi:hypothetical protein GCM10010336_75300 [Streptomyces goshikiensis]|nr:hypothetical protein GCM10010336_75300 [Streptomyces goshikiensis]